MNNSYQKITYFSDEDNCYIVFVPDLPGCFADGKTLEEAHKNIDIIIEEWVEEAERLDREIPGWEYSLESSSPEIFDVAKYILLKTGPISAMMLQKLLYYCQAWALAWYKKELFNGKFEAWKHGPVNRDLFKKFQGKKIINLDMIEEGNPLTASEKEHIDRVLSIYSSEDPEWLSDLTHSEAPWEQARHNEEISSKSMEEYYGNL